MNRVKLYFLVVLGSFVMGCQSTAKTVDADTTLRKTTPIQLFMGTCVVGRQSTEALEHSAMESGFIKAPDNIANDYLKDNAGQAWLLSNADGRFGLTLLENKLCSVFVHQGNPSEIQKSMEAWLPPEGSGFTYKKQLLPQTGRLTTTSYTIFRNGAAIEQWVITIDGVQPTNMVAILSYSSA